MDCNVDLICSKPVVDDYYYATEPKKTVLKRAFSLAVRHKGSSSYAESDHDDSTELEFADCGEEYDDTCVLEVNSLEKCSLTATPDTSIDSLSLNGELLDGENGYSYDLHPLERYDAFSWISQLPPLEVVQPKKRPYVLPPKDDSKGHHEFSLVLDLDETLVHCTTTGTPEMRNLFDVEFHVDFNGKSHLVMGRLRPGVREFLEKCSKHFELIVFTASLKIYAEKILDLLDPNREWITHRLYRDSCLQIESNYIKDLTALNRDLQKTIIVDNSIQAFGYHLDNGIPITSWYQEEDDRELEQIYEFLVSKVKNSKDVTIPLIKQFRITNQLNEFMRRMQCTSS